MDVIRAWKDEEYRRSLSADELAALPANPAGPTELTDEQLASVAGGDTFLFVHCTSWGCPTRVTPSACFACPSAGLPCPTIQVPCTIGIYCI